ncbi:hypothetical protein HG537_0B02280 [Torulaspora globosa]|uniref:J domain-containing protein n=1 Tax=Torulaspora globosa TaxID=48254 RepID=A0A7H9HNK1_9SACH|nr:hypothetical protein HG537_0B02280 [Torulaspora sp. CBS 2947]
MVTSCCENLAWRKVVASRFASFSGLTKSTGLRSYATTLNQAEDNSDIYYDLKWPKNKFPTPYELFGIDKTDGRNIDPKLMKKRYHEYARLYHPDVSQNIRIIRSPIDQMQLDKNLLTVDEKSHRFKVTTQAYQILTDPKKKRLYDFTQSGWPYGPTGATSTTPAAQYPGSHGYRSDNVYAYWNAGTWEDANHMNSEKQPFDAWVLFMWLCGFVICIQATALLTRIEDSLTRQNYTHEETEHDLLQSYTNYGLDTDKISRWRRFLWFRTYGLYRSNTDLDREARRNEEMVQDILKKSEQSIKPVSEIKRPE